MTETYIESIMLENWRQFKGKQEILLRPDGDQQVNAIIGENGTGKTNLAKAVQTCLNGSVPGENATDEEPNINAEVFNSLSTGETVDGRIELRLTHKGTDYVVIRGFSSRKTNNGCDNSIHSELTVEKYDPPGGWVVIDNPTQLLTSILPPEVQQYYFFDGERLDEFFDHDYQQRVQDAVWELSHVEVLDHAIDHLARLRDDRRRKANSTSGEVKQARQEHDEKQAERMNVTHELAFADHAIAKKTVELERIENQMGAAADEEVLTTRQDRVELETKVDQLNDDEDELNEKLNRQLIEAGSICFATEALKTATSELDMMGARDELPPAVRRQYLTGLLEDDECLCGCDLQKRPDHRTNVEELRNNTPGIDDRLIEASFEFPDTRATGKEAFADLRETKQELRETKQTRLEKELEIEELTEQLRDHSIPADVDLEDLDKDRDQLRAALQSHRNRQGRLQERLESVESEIESIKQRIERELEKDERSQELMKEVTWYRDARDRIQEIKQEMMTEVRQDVEDSLDEHYNGLTWKDEDYDLTVESDFNIRIEGPDGPRQIDRLSAGETELLALSFISGMTEVSGFDAPVLIDTPVGRIDQTHRAAIGSKLPRYLAGHQVTFLFTDSEYDDTVSSGLKQYLANQYKLVNDNRVTSAEK